MSPVQLTMYGRGLDKSVYEVRCRYILLQIWLEQSERILLPVAILQSEDAVSSTILDLSDK